MGAAEDIETLASRVARLKVEYEQYFLGVIKREPAKLRTEVERLILAYSGKNLTNTSLKFKLNSTIAKYNSYKQYWTRTLREIEEGDFVRKAETGEPSFQKEALEPTNKAEPCAPPVSASDRDAVLEDAYKKYIEARKACNESTEISYEAVAKAIEQNKSKLKVSADKGVEIKVYIKDGKAKLSILPMK